MKTVSILGSTGSIGQSTLKVVARHSDKFEVGVLTANCNVAELAQQARDVGAKKAVIADDSLYGDLKDALSGSDIEPAAGRNALLDAASEKSDITVAAIMGMAGLEPLLKAIDHGGAVAIANKEPLVAAGPLVMDAARKSGATLLPIDSEHNAIFQVFENHNRAAIEKIILTASGGPFRTWPKEQIAAATVAQALEHPNWSMGQKITIDSASMMNKALEVIEARYLFDLDMSQIDVMVHPQSIIHSMVEYADGSVLAQMGAPDMCTPIANALAWPGRIETPGDRLSISELSDLTFEKPDLDRFPALGLGYDAAKSGQAACLTLNAANEVAVDAFLDGKIGFMDIANLVSQALENVVSSPLNGLDTILEYDRDVRALTERAIQNIKGKNTKAA